jgi:hypothetical protein
VSWADFEVEVSARMTPQLAQRVRELRGSENTWRQVSGKIFDFPEAEALRDWADMKGHQPLGMYLCSAAAKLLGEDPEKEPWN